MKIICPVCGYDEINEPRLIWSICPSCDTQFGLSDAGRTHAELRSKWIANGAQWSSPEVVRPDFWNPIEQLKTIGYQVTDRDLEAMASKQAVSVARFLLRGPHSIGLSGQSTSLAQTDLRLKPNYWAELSPTFPKLG